LGHGLDEQARIADGTHSVQARDQGWAAVDEVSIIHVNVPNGIRIVPPAGLKGVTEFASAAVNIRTK